MSEVLDSVRIPIYSDTDIIIARQRGRELASRLGFTLVDSTLIATVISELARNIVLYAKQGAIALSIEQEQGKRCLVICAEDKGPGIRDVEQALEYGYSTSGGLGLGLPGVRRMMDHFDIKSAPGSGTRVTVKKWVT